MAKCCRFLSLVISLAQVRTIIFLSAVGIHTGLGSLRFFLLGGGDVSHSGSGEIFLIFYIHNNLLNLNFLVRDRQSGGECANGCTGMHLEWDFWILTFSWTRFTNKGKPNKSLETKSANEIRANWLELKFKLIINYLTLWTGPRKPCYGMG